MLQAGHPVCWTLREAYDTVKRLPFESFLPQGLQFFWEGKIALFSYIVFLSEISSLPGLPFSVGSYSMLIPRCPTLLLLLVD